MSTSTIDFEALISDRCRAIDVSGIRRVFELGRRLENPINLSIGQPDFPVDRRIKDAAIRAIEDDRNGYTLTQGEAALRDAITGRLGVDPGWDFTDETREVLVTSGTSGAIMLAFLALLNEADEVIIGDPWFVIYPALATMAGARSVVCDTYPDFRLTAERVEPLITDRTRVVLVNSPGNPSGVALSGREVKDLAELCDRRGIVLLSDEIYDEFTYSDAREGGRCPSPARFNDQTLLVRGFGKTYGCTGWRMGYAAGPTPIIRSMAKLQQYSFVCAPSIAQAGCVAAFDVDMTARVEAYARKRDMVCACFEGHAELVRPGGAFYAFVEVPPRLGLTASEFVEKAIALNVLVIPGSVFSGRDTHFRISYAVPDGQLREGLSILRGLMETKH